MKYFKQIWNLTFYKHTNRKNTCLVCQVSETRENGVGFAGYLGASHGDLHVQPCPPVFKV